MEDRDFLLCNGDTYYSPQALIRVAQADRGITIGIDTSTPLSGDSMKIVLDEIGRLRQVGKKIRTERAHGVSTGLLGVWGSDMRRLFTAAVCRMLREHENTQPRTVWHSVLNHLEAHGVPIEVVELASTDWYEIDTLDDLRELRSLILLLEK
jgi:choline kinase